MYPSRQPITTGNLNAHLANTAAQLGDEPAPLRPKRGSAILARMAEVMREIGEGCTDRELKRAGFTQAEIDRYGEQASDRAALKSRLN